MEVEAEPAQVALVLAKRQAPELTEGCMVYRYGSLATSVDVVRKSAGLFVTTSCTFAFLTGISLINRTEGIESVEIVQVSNVVSMATELDQNAVDVTITCQGR